MSELVVICPTYRNPKYLDLFLKSAVEGRRLSSTQIIVSVDGFYEESKDVLEKYEGKIDVLPFAKNQGMQSAINLAVYQTKGNPNLLIVNDDNVLDPGYDENLAPLNCEQTIYTIEQIETNNGMFGFTVDNLGKTIEEFNFELFKQKAIQLKTIRENIRDDKRGRIFPFLVSKHNFMIVNGFDVLFDSPNLCDWDAFLKWELLGLTFRRTFCSIFYHFGSVSTKKNSESSIFIDKERKAIETFKYKWGFDPMNGKFNKRLPDPTHSPFSPHRIFIPSIDEFVNFAEPVETTEFINDKFKWKQQLEVLKVSPRILSIIKDDNDYIWSRKLMYKGEERILDVNLPTKIDRSTNLLVIYLRIGDPIKLD